MKLPEWYCLSFSQIIKWIFHQKCVTDASFKYQIRSGKCGCVHEKILDQRWVLTWRLDFINTLLFWPDASRVLVIICMPHLFRWNSHFVDGEYHQQETLWSTAGPNCSLHWSVLHCGQGTPENAWLCCCSCPSVRVKGVRKKNYWQKITRDSQMNNGVYN